MTNVLKNYHFLSITTLNVGAYHLPKISTCQQLYFLNLYWFSNLVFYMCEKFLRFWRYTFRNHIKTWKCTLRKPVIVHYKDNTKNSHLYLYMFSVSSSGKFYLPVNRMYKEFAIFLFHGCRNFFYHNDKIFCVKYKYFFYWFINCL